MGRILAESLFDKAALIRQFGGDRQSACRAVAGVLEQLPWLLADLRRAQQGCDRRALARALQALKGTLGGPFAHSAYQLTQRLEKRALGDDPLATEQMLQALDAQICVLVRHLQALRDELKAAGSSGTARR